MSYDGMDCICTSCLTGNDVDFNFLNGALQSLCLWLVKFNVQFACLHMQMQIFSLRVKAKFRDSKSGMDQNVVFNNKSINFFVDHEG